MVLIHWLVATACLLATSTADTGIFKYHKDSLTVQACTSVLGKTATLFGKKDKKKYCNVKNQPALGSMAQCLHDMPHKGKTIEVFLDSCKKYKLTLEEFQAAYENALHYMVKNTSAVPGFNKTKLFSLPVKVPKKKLNGAYNSVLHRYYNYNYANYFGWVLLCYWFLLVLIAGVIRTAQFAMPKVTQLFNGKASNFVRRYVTLPALGRGKNQEDGLFFGVPFKIPTRFETLMIFGWFILALAFNVCRFQHDKNNVVWAKQLAEMGRKVADRTGIMSLYIIPEMVLFAGRNNFTRWISGWPYARFNRIHQWQARVCFILFICHAVGMTYNGKGIGKYFTRNAKPYVRWGYVALVSASILCTHSLLVFRRKYYELFVLLHNVLAAIFVAAVWIHTADDKFEAIQYATVAAWGFDKLMRLARMAMFGVKTAEVQLIADETLRVKVPRNRWWRPFPLSHAFIYFFRPTCFWQLHPFTVVDSAVEDKTITMYIKVKGGMTHSLCRYLNTQPERKARIKCSVEGPYGSRAPLQHYSSAVFLSGGNGVPGMYAAAVNLARTQLTQKIQLYWIIRHWKLIEWFYDELKALEQTLVQPIVYVTQYDTPLDRDFIEKVEEDVSLDEKRSTDGEKTALEDVVPKLKQALHFVEFRAGRPDLEGLVAAEIAEAQGLVAFVACGHNSFVDKLRKIIANLLPEGKRVDFYDQMETW